MIFSSIVSIVLPMINKKLMDDGIVGRDFSIVLKMSLIILFLVLIDQGLGIIETKEQSFVNNMIQYNLRKISFKKLLRLNMQYFNTLNFAETINNINMDIGNICKLSDKSTFIIVGYIFKIIGGIIGLLLLSWKLTFLVILIIPVRCSIIWYLAKKRKSLFEESMNLNSDYSAWYGDSISGIKEIKLWGIERLKIAEFIAKQRKLIKNNINMMFMDKANQISESIVFECIKIIIYVIGSYMIFSNKLTIGSLLALITYSLNVLAPISAILNIGYDFSTVIPASKRFLKFLEMKSEDSIGSSKKLKLYEHIDLENLHIKFENVSFSYDENKTILENINLDIKNGEKIAIIGKNGVGKSTLINLLLRFYTPQIGKIYLNNIDINKFKIQDYRKLVSVVSQDLYLFNTSIKENININRKLKELDIYRMCKEIEMHEFIEKMPQKYDTKIGRNGSKLSGGERQKIALCRALSSDSKVIILDEATSNFDLKSELVMDEIIKNKFKDKILIAITHRPSILKNMDKILVVSEGNISSINSYKELIENSSLYRKIINYYE